MKPPFFLLTLLYQITSQKARTNVHFYIFEIGAITAITEKSTKLFVDLFYLTPSVEKSMLL